MHVPTSYCHTHLSHPSRKPAVGIGGGGGGATVAAAAAATVAATAAEARRLTSRDVARASAAHCAVCKRAP